MLTKVTRLENLDGFRLRVLFNDGSEGVHDFSSMVNEPGSMIAPLREESYFARVFLDSAPRLGLTASTSHPSGSAAMAAAGELKRVAAE